jgi:hypothetical protein
MRGSSKLLNMANGDQEPVTDVTLGICQRELIIIIIICYNRYAVFLQLYDSSVGIATRYGLDVPGFEPRWGRDFPHPSRPDLGLNQPPIQWVQCLSRG